MERKPYNPWLSKESREQFEAKERRYLFELVMADVDRGNLDMRTALAVLSLSDDMLIDTHEGQLVLFELQDGDVST